MADPRLRAPAQRKNPLSPLMQAKRAASSGSVVNFCPFGCGDDALDDHGYCHHLVGFTSDGRVMECRVRRSDGRIITSGTKKQELQRGDVKVKVTTSARVYRREGVPGIASPRHASERSPLDEKQDELKAQLQSLMNPVLEGAYDEPTGYDDDEPRS